jgi:hypothetical protein
VLRGQGIPEHKVQEAQGLKYAVEGQVTNIEFRVDTQFSSRVTVIKGVRNGASIALQVLVDVIRA